MYEKFAYTYTVHLIW